MQPVNKEAHYMPASLPALGSIQGRNTFFYWNQTAQEYTWKRNKTIIWSASKSDCCVLTFLNNQVSIQMDYTLHTWKHPKYKKVALLTRKQRLPLDLQKQARQNECDSLNHVLFIHHFTGICCLLQPRKRLSSLLLKKIKKMRDLDMLYWKACHITADILSLN